MYSLIYISYILRRILNLQILFESSLITSLKIPSYCCGLIRIYELWFNVVLCFNLAKRESFCIPSNKTNLAAKLKGMNGHLHFFSISIFNWCIIFFKGGPRKRTSDRKLQENWRRRSTQLWFSDHGVLLALRGHTRSSPGKVRTCTLWP